MVAKQQVQNFTKNVQYLSNIFFVIFGFYKPNIFLVTKYAQKGGHKHFW